MEKDSLYRHKTSPVTVWWGKIEDRDENSLSDCKENYNGSIIFYKRGEIFKLKYPLYLIPGSWCSDGKWILFSVDWVNVRTSWESSLWMVNEVTQLLSTKDLKEIVGKNKLVRSKLLEKLNSLFFFSQRSWSFYGLQPKFFWQRIFSDPSSIANWAIYRSFRG